MTDLDLTIDQLWQLIDASRGNDAISMIEKLEDATRKHTDVMRIKSIAHASAGGDISETYAILRELVTRPDSSIEDLYWAGQRAAEFFDYKDAEEFLTSAIDRSKREDYSYYLNCALLLRAYVRCHLRKFSEAREDLDEIAEDDTEIFWSDRLGHISKENLVHHLSGSHPSPTRSAAPCSCRKGKGSNSETD
ncbi:MAG TPA: hypothetical protein VN229_15670 [Terriglobales bacterium]|nr:hypothetical protein [Terriglobales bacterium]